MRTFKRNPLTVQAVQWLGDNEAEVKELAGAMFQSVAQCPEGESCQACEDHGEITGELTIKGTDTEDEDQDDYTQGMETGWWVIKLPDGRLACMSDSTLQYNFREVVP